MKENKKKNSIGTIRKRGNRYEGRVYVIVDGKSVQKSVYGDTEREVNDKMRAKKGCMKKNKIMHYQVKLV